MAYSISEIGQRLAVGVREVGFGNLQCLDPPMSVSLSCVPG
ncbi:MAG: hypothetical protein ACI9R3_005104 [Verrucomicrobiales bacterium]|jgi:hypothetical protein